MSRKKDLIRYTLRNERQLENCLRAIAEEFIKRQSDPKAKPLQIIGKQTANHFVGLCVFAFRDCQLSVAV